MALNEKSFALAGGIIWSLTIFGTTLLSVATGYAQDALQIYANIHPGYSITVAGAFIGLIYAFVCSTIGLYVFAKLYNYIENKGN